MRTAPRSLVRTVLATSITVSLLFVTGVTRADAPSPPATDGDAAEASRLSEKGKALFRKGKLEAAYDAFLAAWTIRQAPEIAANLAATELELGRHREAAEHLAFAVRNPAPGTTAETLRALQTALEEAKSNIATVRLTVEPRTAELHVDGSRVDGEVVSSELYLDPGEHTLTAAAPGHEPRTLTIQVHAGELLDQRMELNRLQAPVSDPWKDREPAAAPTTMQQEAPSASSASSWEHKATALMIGGPIVLASTGTALSFLRAASAARDDAASLATACETPCDEEDGARDEESRNETVTVVAFAVAGGAALGTSLYLLLAESNDRESHASRRSYVPVWIGSGVVAASLASGIAFLAQSSSADGDRSSLLTELQRVAGENPCATGTPYVRACAAVFSNARGHTLNRDLAITAFVTAGASAIGTAAYVLFPSMTIASRERRNAVRMEPSLRGVTVRVSF